MRKWCSSLVERGMGEEKIVYIDAEEPVLRHLATGEQVLEYLHTQLPDTGRAILVINEPASFPEYASCIGTLLGKRELDIYTTTSFRRFLNEELYNYLHGGVSQFLMLPGDGGIEQSATVSRARWDEIILRDVLPALHTADVRLVEAIAGYLSDNVGDAISLRSIAYAVSPPGKIISPNTADAYLKALCDAFLVEKIFRINEDDDEELSSGYRVFFHDLALRRMQFGPAPLNEDERCEMNVRWLKARRKSQNIHLPTNCDLSSEFIGQGV